MTKWTTYLGQWPPSWLMLGYWRKSSPFKQNIHSRSQLWPFLITPQKGLLDGHRTNNTTYGDVLSSQTRPIESLSGPLTRYFHQFGRLIVFVRCSHFHHSEIINFHSLMFGLTGWMCPSDGLHHHSGITAITVTNSCWTWKKIITSLNYSARIINLIFVIASNKE